MNTSVRLKKLLKSLKITQNEFAKEVGLTQGTVSDIIRGKTKGLSEPIAKLCRYLYNVNPKWLLSGEGEMFLSNDNNQTDEAFKFIEEFLYEFPYIESVKTLPLYDKKNVSSEFVFSTDFLPNDDYFAFPVRGYDMVSQNIFEGDIAICKLTSSRDDLSQNDIVCILNRSLLCLIDKNDLSTTENVVGKLIGTWRKKK